MCLYIVGRELGASTWDGSPRQTTAARFCTSLAVIGRIYRLYWGVRRGAQLYARVVCLRESEKEEKEKERRVFSSFLKGLILPAGLSLLSLCICAFAALCLCFFLLCFFSPQYPALESMDCFA